MGNDGGTIARGQDLKAVYSQTPEQGPKVLDDGDKALFSTCALSSLPLFEDGVGHSVVSDFQGKLYLKEKMLELLLEKKVGGAEKLPHIAGLADLVDLTISWTADGHVLCPVTGTSKLSHSNLAYLRPCGCVFSNRVLTEMRVHFKISEEVDADHKSQCPVCEHEFAFNYDIVLLNPQNEAGERFNSETYEFLQQQQMSHRKKSTKKRKKRHEKKEVKKVETEEVKKEQKEDQKEEQKEDHEEVLPQRKKVRIEL